MSWVFIKSIVVNKEVNCDCGSWGRVWVGGSDPSHVCCLLQEVSPVCSSEQFRCNKVNSLYHTQFISLFLVPSE